MHRNHTSIIKLLAAIAALSILSGCAMAPGMNANFPDNRSNIRLPVKDGEGGQPENVSIRPITAELIMQQERDFYPQKGVPDPQSENYNYTLGPGDILSIIVWDHPELTIPAGAERSAEQSGTVVNENGTIYYPYAGIVRVAGLNVREVRDLLTKALSRVIENVQLEVRMAEFRSKRIYVVGEVRNPGIKRVTDIAPTVLEMVNQADGFTDEADYRNITLTRKEKTYRIDLLALYENGNVEQNVLLEPGDVINVPDRQLNKIFVLGEVNNPGSLLMNKSRKTLAEAISDAGDVNNNTADPSQIFIMRGNNGTPEVYHLDARTPDAMLLADRFPLQPRDVIYVDVAEIVRWNRVISNVLPTLNSLSTASGTSFPLFKGGR